MSNVNSLESEFAHWTMACYETEKKGTHWCGDGNSRGWDEPTQCGPSPKATCYQAERRGSFNLHLNTFHSSRSFALISPIIFGNGQMSSWHNVGAHHHREKPHTWCQFRTPGSFQCSGPIWQLRFFAVQGTFQLDLLAVTKQFCAHLRGFSPPLSLPLSRSFSPWDRASIWVPWENQCRMILSSFWFPLFVQH